MPQTLSKCRRPSHDFTSTPTGDRLKDRARIWCNRKRFKWQRKMNRSNSLAAPTCVPREEDWEREIEEFSQRTGEEKEKEMSDKTPYDAEEDLKVALCEMSLYSVPRAPSPHQQHYNPSTRHTPPVKWIHHVSCIEADQFADAEE